MWCESENCDQFIAGMAQCEPDDDVCLDLWQGQYDDCVDECLEQNSNCMEGCDLLVGSCTATCDCCEPDCDSKDCGDDSCGGSCGACKFWEKCVGGKCDLKSPALIISDPMNNEYIMMDPLGTSITVTMDIDWAPYPHASKSIECYLAGVLVGSTEASQFEFTNVPPGVSTLACRLTENGEPLMTENSTAVVTIKVRKPCLEHSDCKDGNPCSIDACVVSNSAGEKMCAYGPVYSACCCVSGFDCLKPGGGDFWFTCSVPNSTCYYGCIEDGQCDDNNPCTEDTCEPCEGCINEWIDIPECDFDG
jgi:hypothetical protein